MRERVLEPTDTEHAERAVRVARDPAALRPRDIVLSLVALVTVSATQPLLDLLGRNAPFLVAHDAGRLDVIALAVGLTTIVPLLVAAAILLVRVWSPRLGEAAHFVTIVVLIAVLVLVMVTLADLGGWVAGQVWISLAVALGVAAAAVYRRSAAIRRAVSGAAVAAPVVAGLFLFASPVSGLVFAPDEPQGRVNAHTRDLPPIVFVMFDELPLASLLEEDLRIDREWYPSFARFADDASLFTNFTTVHEASADAVPAAVSGRFSDPQALPNASGHPTNMFSLLADRYRIRAVEPLTDLCSRCDPQESGQGATTGSSVAMIRDLGVVAAHLVVPHDMAGGLPPLDASWRDFARSDGTDTEVGADAQGDAGVHSADTSGAKPAEQKPRYADHPRIFRRFTASLGKSTRPTLDFLHLIFPHRPWRFLPDGRRHTGGSEPAQHDGLFWIDREWPVAQGYQAHLAQVQLADVFIGDLMKKLQRAGMYDRALIVVTADHGISFKAGHLFRKVTPETFGGIAPVPLFIKAPGQTRGRIDETPMQSIDLLPTVLDLIEVDAPVDFDGRSVLDKAAPPLRERVVFAHAGAHREFPADARPFLRDAVQHRLQTFGDGARRQELFHLAPPGTGQLLGRALTGAEPSALDLTVALKAPQAFADVDHSARVVPACVVGRIVGPAAADRPVLAVAVNGRIAAVTQADLGDNSIGGFRALMSPSSLRQGKNEVQILLVEDDESLSVIPMGN